jgi:type II secretory ATPase GspE/PulE/Tfp pilus assembly ATPase PilB-like protein/DNA-binding response OmpR family regulator
VKDYGALFGGNGDKAASVTTERVPYRLLFVDDEPSVLAALKRVFRRENYEIQTVTSAIEALQLMAANPVHLVMTDFRMPGMNGADFLSQVRVLAPTTLRLMLTGHAETDAVMGGIKDGAVYRFILKPWNDDDLRVTVALALEQYELIQKNKQLQNDNEQKNRDIDILSRLNVGNRSQLAILLHKKGLLNANQIQVLHREGQQRKVPVLRLIIEKSWLEEKRIHELLKKELLFDEVDLREFQADKAVLTLIPKSICFRQLLLPMRVQGKRLRVAMADPLDVGLIDEISFSTGLTLDPVLAFSDQIEDKLKEAFGESHLDLKELETVVSGSDPSEGIEIVIEDHDDASSIEELLSKSDEPPTVRLVNAIILEAMRLGASDIHIQPRVKNVVVRYRIDGVLQDKIQIPVTLLLPVVSRIKIMSELDISERRKPQDGRITVKTSMRIVDLRISTLPTINGEKIVMRVLDRQSSVQRVDDLKLSAGNLERLLNVMTKPQGIVLATGPTGSGKTTTLYALLQHNASSEKNYVTIEDPVEFHVDMAGQVPVRDRIGLNFSTILRAVLRQDPDVILLGEIRDSETAEVAFHAALTGHQVFSTLHTNSAIATIARLLDLGLKPYVIATALEAIIAQRLLRRVCQYCKHETLSQEEAIRKLGPVFAPLQGKSVFAGKGCDKCLRGYQGRVGVHEVLVFDDQLRGLISKGVSTDAFQEVAVREGFVSMLYDAFDKVKNGTTTPEEVLRVLGAQIQF